MNIENKNLFLVVLVTLFFVLCGPILLPSWRLIFFAPLLVIMYYKKPLVSCLWISCLCGLMLDLLSSQVHFGLYASCYTLTTALLYSQRYNFFADSISTLPLMTFFFSVLSTLIQWGMVYAFEQKSAFSLQWIATDLIYMPFMDASYAFILFVIPNLFFGKRIRRGSDYFVER